LGLFCWVGGGEALELLPLFCTKKLEGAFPVAMDSRTPRALFLELELLIRLEVEPCTWDLSLLLRRDETVGDIFPLPLPLEGEILTELDLEGGWDGLDWSLLNNEELGLGGLGVGALCLDGLGLIELEINGL